MKPADKARLEFVRQWLDKAEEDYKLAKHLVADKTPFRSAAGFHAQQSAEKYLKAFLVYHQIEFPKTHDLGDLLDLVSTIDQKLSESLSDVTSLNPYGVTMRYPSDAVEVMPEDAKEALRLVTTVRDTIKNSLHKVR